MAVHREYDLAVVVGSYTDKNTGTQKNRYQAIGTMMRSDDGGKFILLDPLINLAAVPRGQGKDRVMVSMFEPRDQNAQASSQPAYQANSPAQLQGGQSSQNHAHQGGYYNADGSPMSPQQVNTMQTTHPR